MTDRESRYCSALAVSRSIIDYIIAAGDVTGGMCVDI